MKLDDRYRKIEMVLSDVDGVLTDGGITFDNQGIESKQFHIRDGLGIRLWQRAGFRFGILTARTSHIVRLRAVELGIEIVRQGFEEKLSVAQQVIRLETAQLEMEQLSMEQLSMVGLSEKPRFRKPRLRVPVAQLPPGLLPRRPLTPPAVPGPLRLH